MPSRPSWKGSLQLSLVSVPVKGYTAAVTGGGEIHFNQLHDKCHSRIKYQKVCPVHGEITNDEIVSGYEYARDQYVIVDKNELERLNTRGEKPINIDKFIPAASIEPVYFEGRTFYQVPDGPAGQKPFALLYRAMLEEDRIGIALAGFSGREQVVLLRPHSGLITKSLLNFESQIKQPSAFEDEIPTTAVSDAELKLAKTLIEQTSVEDPDLAGYKDHYTEKVTELIEAKVAGRKIVAPPSEEAPSVINLMDALRKSINRGQQKSEKKKPAKKMAPSASELTSPPKRKRKSS